MIRVLAEIFELSVQCYMLAIFVCKIYKVKKPYKKSLFLAAVQQWLSYVVVNFVLYETPMLRIVGGMFSFIIVGLFFYEGSRMRQIFNAISQYVLLLMIDLMTQFLLVPDFMESLAMLPDMEEKLLGRNMVNAILFLLFTFFDIYTYRKESKDLRKIMLLAGTLGGVQIVILNLLAKVNRDGMVSNRIVITVIFNIIVIAGYLVVKEVFAQIIKQQKKQAELEQMAMEKKYQYDYYKMAHEQGERMRDMRHDIRNQLQTIGNLLCSASEENRDRAENMLKELSEKVI